MMNNNVRIIVYTEIFTRILVKLNTFFALICIAISSDLARFFDDDGPEIEFKDKNEDGKNTKYFG